MKTKLIYLFMLTLLLFTAACGNGDDAAKTQEYTANEITVMVPADWQATYEAAQQQIMLAAPRDEYALGIQILETGDATAEEFAQAMSEELEGGEPQPAAKYGEYQFNCEIMGYPSNIIILSKDGYSLVLVEVGDFDKFSELSDAALKSMKSTKAEFQNIIGAIKF